MAPTGGIGFGIDSMVMLSDRQCCYSRRIIIPDNEEHGSRKE